jgi:hypothetical protein
MENTSEVWLVHRALRLMPIVCFRDGKGDVDLTTLVARCSKSQRLGFIHSATTCKARVSMDD